MLAPVRVIALFIIASLALLAIGTQQPAYAPPKPVDKPVAGGKKPIDRSGYQRFWQRQAAARNNAGQAAPVNNAVQQQVRVPPAQSGYTAARSPARRFLAEDLPSPPGAAAPAARAKSDTYGELKLKPAKPPMKRRKKAPKNGKPAAASAAPQRAAVVAVRPIGQQAQAPATATTASTTKPQTNALPRVSDTVNKLNASGVVLAPRNRLPSGQSPAQPPSGQSPAQAPPAKPPQSSKNPLVKF